MVEFPYTDGGNWLVLFQRLRELGATRVTFHPDGKLASVDFAGYELPAPATPDKQDGGDANFVTPRAFRELMRGEGFGRGL